MIDFHSHILPRVDDGSIDHESAIVTAKILAAAGFTRVCCTPHMLKGLYDNEPADIRTRTNELQEALERYSIQLELFPGAEYCFVEHLPAFLNDPLPLPFRCILAEVPFQGSVSILESLVDMIHARGFTPLIAHPERTPLFAPSAAGDAGGSVFIHLRKIFVRDEVMQEKSINTALARLIGKGCCLQGNIGSFAGVYGRRVFDNALFLLDEGLYSCLGSDAHRPEQLEEVLRRGLATIRNRIGSGAADRLLSGELLTVSPGR